MNEYESSKAERIERCRLRAAKARARSDAAWQANASITGAIPLGQPILVGHHSEKRHRRDLERARGKMAQCVEESKKAEYWERRARAVECGTAISQDDPDALDKLRDRLEDLEADHATMVAVNKAWRKAGKPNPDNRAGWNEIAGHPDVALSERALDSVRKNFEFRLSIRLGKQPFTACSLSNSTANIARIRKRIQNLEARDQDAGQPERRAGDVRIVDDVEANRLRLYFPCKPDAAMRKELKSFGFRWSPSEGAWQAYRNNRAEWAITKLFPA